MFKRLRHVMSLLRAGRVIARYDGIVDQQQMGDFPWQIRWLLKLAKPFSGKKRRDLSNPLAAALSELGPSYIKLGQFLATRADIVGPARAVDLSELQDRMPPFAMKVAQSQLAAELGQPSDEVFSSFSAPVAAASIAQVHKAVLNDANGESHQVAVKILRPDVERRFGNDLDCFSFIAGLLERWHEPSRRLRPKQAVAILARSVELEMDLRMEAAAMSEMADNTADDPGFKVPQIYWQQTAKRVLTTEWIDGLPLSDLDGLRAANIDFVQLGDHVIQSFLRHAIRDGFFHADMHQGNLFVDGDGDLVAVDFGIMGRLEQKDSRFLAEILYGFITRNYRRVADVHFDAGYVPDHQDPAVFAQALRAIGEPILDKPADQISMAQLLNQLFQVTAQFDMETQPQLLLLQKTMVVVEGVARTLNPHLNMWVTAEPVVRAWMEQKLGAQGKIEEVAEGATTLGRVLGAFPEALSDMQRTAHKLSQMAQDGGVRLDHHTTTVLARENARQGRGTWVALWVGALALVALAVAQFI